MLEGVTRFLAPLQTLGFRDLLDIAFVALALYGALAWFLRSRARFTLVVLGAFSGVYVVSRVLDLELTRVAFQTAITVALVAAVVIFQDDLRRAAERLSSRAWFRRQPVSAPDDGAWVDILVECMETLSRARIGALCVIKGNDHIDHCLSGGVPLGGKPSGQLLLSLFDPCSPGHDGAVVIHRGRVARFGAHLPLSTNVDDSGWLGTRHAAALGLSERSDALVLVVSEESGQMRVAENGRLEEVGSVEALRERIERVRRRVHPPEEAVRRRAFGLVTRNLPLKLGSLAVATALWLGVVGSERAQGGAQGAAPGAASEAMRPTSPAIIEAQPGRGQPT